jgi:hypothetical protein
MKIQFLLDNHEYIEVAPEKLQLRSFDGGLVMLGIDIEIPQTNEDGTPKWIDPEAEVKRREIKVGFRPFVEYRDLDLVPHKKDLKELPMPDADGVELIKKVDIADLKVGDVTQ